MSVDSIVPAPASVEGALIRLLDHDPDLSRHFDAAEFSAAASAITVAARTIPTGPWSPSAQRPAGVIGFLVLDGTILREGEFATRSCAHLIGPGDIIDPWTVADVGPRHRPAYRVLEEAQVAVLNARFAKSASTYPQLLPAVAERLLRQNEQLASLYALALLPRVDTRLIAFFWHLAQRWGRVGRDAVIIPLDLTHRTLGELVGGRRPTVSVALTELDQAGHLCRRPDGRWVLARSSWSLIADTPCPVGPPPAPALVPAS